MIPKLFHQTSKLAKLSWEESYLLARVQRRLEGWQYKLWTDRDLENVFAHNFPQWISSYQSIEKGVVRADLGRYALLFESGGFYMDTDYKVLKDLTSYLGSSIILPVEEGALGNANSPDFKLGNAVLGSEAKHPFWRDLVEYICSQNTLSDLGAVRN